MDTAVWVGIAGALASLVTGLSTYAVGKWHGQRIREQDERKQRIKQFVERYCDRQQSHFGSGIMELIPSGILKLRADSESREALELCRRRVGKHPLGGDLQVLATVDLKRFFDFAAEQRVDFFKTSALEVLGRLK